MTSLAGAAATAAGSDAAGHLLPLALLLGFSYLVVSLFRRRIGTRPGATGSDRGGSDKASIGAWVLLAAILVGVLVASA